jgi:hypothetical protein
MANCQSPQFCSQIPPRGGHVGRLVHRFLPLIRTLGVADWREWAPQLGRAPERAPADARQSLNRRRAESPPTCGATTEVQYDPPHIQPEHGDWRERRNSNARARQWPAPHWICQPCRHGLRTQPVVDGRTQLRRARKSAGWRPRGFSAGSWWQLKTYTSQPKCWELRLLFFAHPPDPLMGISIAVSFVRRCEWLVVSWKNGPP